MSFQVEDGDDATRDAPAMVSSHYEIERLKELQGFAEKKTVNSRPSWDDFMKKAKGGSADALAEANRKHKEELEANRAKLLMRGRNHKNDPLLEEELKKRKKDSKKKKSKKGKKSSKKHKKSDKKRRHHSSSSSSSSSRGRSSSSGSRSSPLPSAAAGAAFEEEEERREEGGEKREEGGDAGPAKPRSSRWDAKPDSAPQAAASGGGKRSRWDVTDSILGDPPLLLAPRAPPDETPEN